MKFVRRECEISTYEYTLEINDAVLSYINSELINPITMEELTGVLKFMYRHNDFMTKEEIDLLSKTVSFKDYKGEEVFYALRDYVVECIEDIIWDAPVECISMNSEISSDELID